MKKIFICGSSGYFKENFIWINDFIKFKKLKNYTINGIINEKLQFYKTTDYNFPIINPSNLTEYIKKSKITDILISGKNNYENKIVW